MRNNQRALWLGILLTVMSPVTVNAAGGLDLKAICWTDPARLTRLRQHRM